MISFIASELLQPTDTLLWYLNPILIYVPSGTAKLEINRKFHHLHTDDILYCDAFTLFNITLLQGTAYLLHLDLKHFSALTQIDTSVSIFCNSAQDMNTGKYEPLRRLITHCLFQANSELENYHTQISLITCLLTDFSVTATDLMSDTSGIKNSIDTRNTALKVTTVETLKTDIELLQFSLQYIQQHYYENIQVKDIAKACHITETYLARIFKEYLPYTPSEFLNETRLLTAKKLLRESTLSLKDISEATGFASPRSFNTFFERKFQMLPAQFRIQENDKAVQTNCTNQTVTAIMENKSSDFTKSLTVDFSRPPLTAIGDTYRLMYVGKLSHLGYQKFFARFTWYQKQFHFKYAIITGLTDDDVLRGIRTPEQIIWDYSIIDDFIQKVLDAGLIPLISISGIPGILSDGTTQFYVTHTSIPTDLSAVTDFYKDFFLHLKMRFGDDINHWKCAIWHIPENIKDMKSLIPLYDLYASLYHIVRTICPGMHIGSPERRILDDNFEEISFFKKYCIKHQCAPDFFIIHTSGEIIKENTASDMMSDAICEANAYKVLMHIRTYKEQLQKHFENTAFICSSFELYGFQNPLNDTLFAASGLSAFLSNAAAVFDMIAVGLLPVQFSGHPSEPEFNKSPRVFTKSGIAKSSGYAYSFLSHLQGDILSQDEHICIVKDRLTVQILMQNPISIQYRVAKNEQDLPKSNIAFTNAKKYMTLNADTEFWPAQPAQSGILLNVRINHITDGVYTLTEYHINTEHGSAFDYWQKEGASKVLTDDDIHYLSSISLPLRLKKNIVIQNQTLSFDCELDANEVCLFVLKKSE